MRLAPLALLSLLGCATEPGPYIAPLPESTGADPAQAASALLGTLSEDRLAEAALDYGSDRRADWSNLPANLLDTDRPGARFGDLSEAELDAALALVDTLSEGGAATVRQIIAADGVLQPDDTERFGWSTANYWIAVYGDPEAAPWSWGVGGHHLAVNVSTDGDRWVLSPTFLGIEPGSFELDGATWAPLDPHVDAGLAFMASLSADEQAQATIAARPEEVETGPGEDGTIPPTVGLGASTLTTEQRDLLIDVLALWFTMLPAEAAEAELAPAREAVGDLHVAWHGPVDGSDAFYFRIQGPELIVEFSTEGAVGAEDGTHYHSVFRVPNNEYGSAF